ncbi:GNAT family N-acetyltransferase [Enterococcus gallinarum]|uniref:GNAT family N-acetyltransferase n=1 Tax=Enterococcus gallinarum TaxID=1353 RepID=UPI001C3DBA21|nr:GNAT family N-acetyltransferase [Enterococcus gallinarum]
MIEGYNVIKSFDILENKKRINQILLEELAEKKSIYKREEKEISFSYFIENDYAGGIVGKVIFSTCYIDLFAVKKKYRSKGIGRELFNTVENYCRINSVKYIYLTTQDYQALEFYLHFGCKVFGELPDVPFKNTTNFFLIKII